MGWGAQCVQMSLCSSEGVVWWKHGSSTFWLPANGVVGWLGVGRGRGRGRGERSGGKEEGCRDVRRGSGVDAAGWIMGRGGWCDVAAVYRGRQEFAIFFVDLLVTVSGRLCEVYVQGFRGESGRAYLRGRRQGEGAVLPVCAVLCCGIPSLSTFRLFLS